MDISDSFSGAIKEAAEETVDELINQPEVFGVKTTQLYREMRKEIIGMTVILFKQMMPYYLSMPEEEFKMILAYNLNERIHAHPRYAELRKLLDEGR